MSHKHHLLVKDFFNEQVSSYFQNFLRLKSGNHYRFQNRTELVKLLANDFNKCSLLECSSGTGEITKAILDQNDVRYADIVDISPKMLTHAKELIYTDKNNDSGLEQQIHFIESDIFDFLKKAQVDGKSYDLILCIGLIAHTGRLQELLHLIHPCLKTKGRLILQSSLLDHWGVKIVRRITRNKYIRQKGYSIIDFYLQDILNTINNCGFSVAEQCRFGFYFPFGDNLWKWGNFYLEKSMEGIAKKMGSDILLVLEKKGSSG